MHKRPITYTDYFTDEVVTKTFYFNLTAEELTTLQFGTDGGFDVYLKRIANLRNEKELIDIFRQMVLLSYGVRSDDGERFIKNDEVSERFTQTPAYSALFMELASNPDKAAEFIKGIMPAEVRELMTEEELKQKTAEAYTKSSDETKRELTTSELAAQQAQTTPGV